MKRKSELRDLELSDLEKRARRIALEHVMHSCTGNEELTPEGIEDCIVCTMYEDWDDGSLINEIKCLESAIIRAFK